MSEQRRIRSPNYPALSLPAAAERIAPLFERERQHQMSREVALKGMGYSSVNGAALGTLSAVLKYGLLEKNGDSFRVAKRAVTILHPASPEEKQSALREAAFAPTLFADLAERFPGGRVSDDNLRSYLVRNGFSSSSLSGVISAFRETMAMVSSDEEESVAPAPLPEPSTHQDAQSRQTPSMPAVQPIVSGPSPWVVSTNGKILTVSAQLDNVRAVDKLIRVLEANKLLLPEEPAEEQSQPSAGQQH